MYIKRDNCLSQKIFPTNGVKQGGVLSPILFNMYIDILLKRLNNADIGCKMGMSSIGALAYADDIIFLCPSINSLKKMIKICEEFAKEYQLTFNSNKINLIVYSLVTGQLAIKLSS